MQLDQSRLAVLQRRRIRKARAPEVMAAWARAGVTASLLSDERQDEVVDLFRGRGKRTRAVGSLQGIIAELGSRGHMVVVVGWDIDNEPAMLIRGDSLARSHDFLRALYPDGFVAANQPFTHAIIVDFDENDFQADEVALPSQG